MKNTFDAETQGTLGRSRLAWLWKNAALEKQLRTIARYQMLYTARVPQPSTKRGE